MSSGDRKHYTPHEDLVDLAAATRDLTDVNTALMTEVKEAIEALTVEMVTTKLEITTDQCPALEINHSGVDSCKVIHLTPTEALTAASSWYAMFMDMTALDPVGAGCDLHGIEIDFSGVDLTHDPDIQGLAVKLPAAYAGGTEVAGYFSGDGRTVSLCTDAYALAISGAMQLDGIITGINSVQCDLGTSINEFSIDGTLAGDSDDAVPTEQAVKTYADVIQADVDGFQDGLKDLTAVEITQLKNIGIVTISPTQWGYLGALDQGLTQASTPTFAGIVTGGDVDGVDVSDLKDDVDGFPDDLKNLAATEIAELENIGATTISAAQWGYLGVLDQTLIQASSPTFVGLTLSGAITGLTTLSMSGQLTNTLAIGTPPFVITSTTVIPNLNVDQVDGYDLDQAVLQASSPTFVGLTLSGAIATATNISMTGELDLTGAVFIDLNPSGSGDIITITPSAAMTGGANWFGIKVDGAALDPVDAGSELRGLSMDFSGVDMANNPSIYALAVTLPATYGGGTERAGYFSGDGRTLIICDDSSALYAIGTVKFTGELDMTGTVVKIDLNPSGTGSAQIVDIRPAASLVENSNWYGMYQDVGALDPATGVGSSIYGFRMLAGGLVSVDNDAKVYGFAFTPPATEESRMLYHVLTEMTQNKAQTALYSYSTAALSATATYDGVYIDWDGLTRDGGAPALRGVNIRLPASYADFGVSYAGYFAGDGRSVTICDTTYALSISGAMLLNGVITGVNSITLDAGATITEFSIDDTLAGDSDAALPTEQAVKAYVDNHCVIGSGNAEWINCPLESWSPIDEWDMDSTGRLSSIRTTVGINYAFYSVPLPTNRGGKNLYINGTRIGLSDADVGDYITSTYIDGYLAGAVTAIDSDTTDKQTVDEHEDTSMDVDCSGYSAIKVRLHAQNSTTARDLEIDYVTVRYYYA